MAERRQWLVTVADTPTRTRDVIVPAHGPWSARWLYQLLHPQDQIFAIRPARASADQSARTSATTAS